MLCSLSSRAGRRPPTPPDVPGPTPAHRYATVRAGTRPGAGPYRGPVSAGRYTGQPRVRISLRMARSRVALLSRAWLKNRPMTTLPWSVQPQIDASWSSMVTSPQLMEPPSGPASTLRTGVFTVDPLTASSIPDFSSLPGLSRNVVAPKSRTSFLSSFASWYTFAMTLSASTSVRSSSPSLRTLSCTSALSKVFSPATVSGVLRLDGYSSETDAENANPPPQHSSAR